jgi:hypothetical protein
MRRTTYFVSPFLTEVLMFPGLALKNAAAHLVISKLKAT